jgi:hypothetical protein
MSARLRLAVVVALFALATASASAAEEPTAPLFASYDVLPLTLEAPFNDLFEHARTNAAYAVIGKLSYTHGGRDVTVEGVKITLRGNTSRRETECAFPKLKVQLPANVEAGPLVAAGDSLKLGTHCGEAGDDELTAKYGRLPNERSPLREAFVYRLLESVGVPTLKARPARVSYVYTDVRPGQSPPQDQPVVRNALLLEDTDDAVKRFGGAREIGEKQFTNAEAAFQPADTARIAFAEAMIGNYDWCLRMKPGDSFRCNARHPLWNIVAAASAGGKAVPIIYDFDVSGMVAGRPPWLKTHFNESFVPSRSPIEVAVLAQVQRTRALFSRAQLDATRAEFVKRKNAAYQALASGALDAAGKTVAKSYLDAFYAAIESNDAFYRPVVAAPGGKLYANESRAVACGATGTIPAGTPVSDPLQTKDGLVQVVVLDALWQWTPPAKCAAVREGPVWIEAGSISRNFPNRD